MVAGIENDTQRGLFPFASAKEWRSNKLHQMGSAYRE